MNTAKLQVMAASIEEKRNTVGVVHLGLYGSKQGLIVSWRQTLEAIAEPSEPYPSNDDAAITKYCPEIWKGNCGHTVSCLMRFGL